MNGKVCPVECDRTISPVKQILDSVKTMRIISKTWPYVTSLHPTQQQTTQAELLYGGKICAGIHLQIRTLRHPYLLEDLTAI